MLQYLWAECVSKARAKIRLPSLGQISVVHERKSTYGLNLNFWSQSNRILIGQNPKFCKPQGFSTRFRHVASTEWSHEDHTLVGAGSGGDSGGGMDAVARRMAKMGITWDNLTPF
jgi:hypothetical protein